MIRKKFLRMAIIWLIMGFLLIALIDSYCRAEPYIVYAPTIKILKYEVEVNGDVSEVAPNVVGENMQLVYDLKDLPVGANVIRARAQFEVWGWVPWSEPFTVIRPSALENPQVVTNPQLP